MFVLYPTLTDTAIAPSSASAVLLRCIVLDHLHFHKKFWPDCFAHLLVRFIKLHLRGNLLTECVRSPVFSALPHVNENNLHWLKQSDGAK